MPGIDGAVGGRTAASEREASVRFAADHRREDLRGKAGVARVKLVEVKEKVLPALDDEFARSLGDYATVAALTDALRRQLEREREQDNRRALEGAGVECMLGRAEVPVTGAQVMRHVRRAIAP